MKPRLAIDIGGTFTDVVLEIEERICAKKVLTTHAEPADAVMNGIHELLTEESIDPGSIAIVLHGTTLATNAIIERRGAKTALLTTEGHRDVLAMAFENRFEQYDVNIERPEPLIPRSLRLPIRERMGADGHALINLDRNSVDVAVDTLRSQEIESVAIGFLHSYANASHEDEVAAMVKAALPSVAISVSSQVCPEIREYERFSTTCANAYVLPLMEQYLVDLSTRLHESGIHCPFMVMTSNGGLATLDTAKQFPIRLVESGPAGGTVLAAWKAKELGARHALSFDMGGTTAKICLIDDGEILRSRSFEVDRRYRFKRGSGLPVRIPVIEMVEIGAGGGSIAEVDRLNRVRVGPESAGSEPGPSCYGQGGVSPTVTDADVVLGRLDREKFAGGRLTLNLEASKQAIAKQIADPLNTTVRDGAKAISEVVDENMASASRSHASEWGKSVGSRLLIAFGGAAPMHATRLMEKLNCDSVLIPVDAGVGSALGFLRSPIAYEVVHSHYLRLSRYDSDVVRRIFNSMKSDAAEALAGTINLSEANVRATSLMRYVGQGYEISVDVDIDDISLETLKKRFEVSYKSLYGRLLPDAEIEAISWTLTLSTAVENPVPIEPVQANKEVDFKYTSQELVEIDRSANARCIERSQLKPGHTVRGPALITEQHTTTVVPSEFKAIVNQNLDVLIQRIDK